MYNFPIPTVCRNPQRQGSAARIFSHGNYKPPLAIVSRLCYTEFTHERGVRISRDPFNKEAGENPARARRRNGFLCVPLPTVEPQADRRAEAIDSTLLRRWGALSEAGRLAPCTEASASAQTRLRPLDEKTKFKRIITKKIRPRIPSNVG